MIFSDENRTDTQVAELLGLYGPVAIPELLVQKIWLRGDFAQDGLRTEEGQTLQVIHPGRWNRLGGPDFVGAEIEVDGRRLLGDVEIHFYQRDWRSHGHEVNVAFDGTVLHVIVFEPTEGESCAVTSKGRVLPTLVLAPRLREGLEEYAMRDAMRALEQTDPLELAAPLLETGLNERRERLRMGAAQRWAQKRYFAAKRLAEAGSWDAACHAAMLEVLGYRRNRGVMLDLADRFPIEQWRVQAGCKVAEGEAWIDGLFAAGAKLGKQGWRLQGNRPANQPRRRLEQYFRIMRDGPDWPARIAQVLAEIHDAGEESESTGAFRHRTGWRDARKRVFVEIWRGHLPAPRADTVLIDGLLPLAAAHFDRSDLRVPWMHWWPGDLPEALRAVLRTARVVSPQRPFSNGLQQGALQLLIERKG